MANHLAAYTYKNGEIAVYGAAAEHRLTRRAFGGFGLLKAMPADGGTTRPAWMIQAKFASVVPGMVERLNRELDTEVSAQAARRSSGAALAPSRFRNLLGQCGHCDDGRCCGRCSCCS